MCVIKHDCLMCRIVGIGAVKVDVTGDNTRVVIWKDHLYERCQQRYGYMYIMVYFVLHGI